MHTALKHVPHAGLLFFFAGLMSSCTSLVYSPFLHLPAAPMTAGQTEVSGSAGAFPETGFAGAAGGGDGLLRYAITDHFTLEGQGWSRFGDIANRYIDGTSLDAMITLTDPPQIDTRPEMSLPHQLDRFSRYDFAIVPRAMSMFGANQIGMAGSVSAALWLPSFWVLRPYVATGGIAGSGVMSGQFGGSGYGYGMLNNVGLTTFFNSHFSLNFEIANSIVWTTMTRETIFYYTPSLSVSWLF